MSKCKWYLALFCTIFGAIGTIFYGAYLIFSGTISYGGASVHGWEPVFVGIIYISAVGYTLMKIIPKIVESRPKNISDES